MSEQRPIFGILWMVATGLAFVAVNVLVKIVGPRLPAAEAAFLRFALGLVFIIPALPALRRMTITARQWKLISLRGFVHTLAVITWFYAMAHIPMAEVTALNYLNPVLVTVGAALFLGEKLAKRRIFAICFALVGALIILRPGAREIDLGHLAMLCTALGFAVGYLIAKQLSSEMPATMVVTMLSLSVTVGMAPFAAFVWVTPTMHELAMLLGVAFFATIGHYTMTRAFAAAPLSVTQPVTFLQLVWSASIGAMFFGEPADGFVLLGGGIIIASISFITWREAQARKRITPAPTEAKH